MVRKLGGGHFAIYLPSGLQKHEFREAQTLTLLGLQL